ncbi:MAG: lipopolysaccharide kinase InaA family protein [Candidatus Absconditabacteria bacterium]
MEENNHLNTGDHRGPVKYKSYASGKDILSAISGKNINEIAVFVINEIEKGLQPMTFGGEGEIYKISFNGQQFIVAKRLFSHTGGKEFKMHKRSFDVVKNEHIFHDVSIPQPYLYTTNGDDEYIIMEYVTGPTLYTRIIEKIIQSETGMPIECEDDRDAEKNLVLIFGVQEAKKIIETLTNTPLKYKHHKLFTKQESDILIKNLESFLSVLHKQGIYHRDLGGNIRNIFVKQNLKCSVIDFGRALDLKHTQQKIPEKDIYLMQESGKQRIEYFHDEDIIKIIKSYTENNNKKNF